MLQFTTWSWLKNDFCKRSIHKIENILIKSDKFHLPKKLPHGAGIDWNVVIVDATEMTIER
ncbi:hypothetical protein, partial [Acinetobacter junii]|uniref:hypothetical protein n=1 Tax=Acinetobacter junii TaxID=40215 RepID=UPI00124F9F24